MNKIRPISVYGPIIKLLEKCVYKDLYDQVIKKISICQTDFIGILGTEVNLLKLRNECLKLKKQKKMKYIYYLLILLVLMIV